jgi:hypothetical protein
VIYAHLLPPPAHLLSGFLLSVAATYFAIKSVQEIKHKQVRRLWGGGSRRGKASMQALCTQGFQMMSVHIAPYRLHANSLPSCHDASTNQTASSCARMHTCCLGGRVQREEYNRVSVLSDTLDFAPDA